MPQPLAGVIDAIKTTVRCWEIRSAPTATDRLEAVIARPELERVCGLLQEALGPAAKAFGKPVQLEPAAQRVADQLGGIRTDQCLFFKPEANGVSAYAVLWPWTSDTTRVTVKIGIMDGAGS